MHLTESQEKAYDKIINDFLVEKIVLLSGSAGTGKTTLTKYICNYYSENNKTICAIAPTHKSKKIIDTIVNEKSIIKVPTYTVASFLGKIKEHSYIGTKKYSDPILKKIQGYYLFIVDEVSMISDKDLKIIINYIKNSDKRLLIIGDPYQIPCPSSPVVHYMTDTIDIIRRSDSFVFSDTNIIKIHLTEIIRQNKCSPILQLACYVRDNIDNEFTIESTNYSNKYIISPEKIYDLYKLYYENHPYSTKIIAYTNQSVRIHNIEVRKKLGFNDMFVINDLLTGYNNSGWPEYFIENGQDYIITDNIYTDTYSINKYSQLSGNLIDFKILNTNVIVEKKFFINIKSSNNYEFMIELMNRAEKVNNNFSTKKDYQKYMELKNHTIFMDDIYKYDNNIMSEMDFKEMHPLLFTKIENVISITSKEIIKSELTEKMNKLYNNIIELRLLDNKNICESETFADKFKVIEKDIYYGYAITAHKSQGSTYHNVFVDEIDFQKISDKWNYKYNRMESRIREKNQLKYVSYTRAKEFLYIIL